jgi:hypothetical protein
MAPGQVPSAHVGGAFGVSVPFESLASGHDAGFHLSGFVDYHLPAEVLGLRGELSYQRFEPKPGASERANQAFGFVLNAVYYIPGHAFHPYFIGGMGAYRTTDNSSRPGFNAGWGIHIPLTGMSAFFEARILQLLGNHPSYL